jgi:hypothetical protein
MRWRDGTQWSPHTQPPPGMTQDAQPRYPDTTAPATGGYDAFREQSAGQQQYGRQARQPSFTSYPQSYGQQPYPPQDQPRPHSQEPYASQGQRRHSRQQAPRKRRRMFLWVFLGIQALFIAWIIAGVANKPAGTPIAQQVAQQCGNGGWQGLFKSYADCTKHYAVALNDAADTDTGKGIGVALIVAVWVVVDIILGISYGIYKLARRPA